MTKFQHMLTEIQKKTTDCVQYITLCKPIYGIERLNGGDNRGKLIKYFLQEILVYYCSGKSSHLKTNLEFVQYCSWETSQ